MSEPVNFSSPLLCGLFQCTGRLRQATGPLQARAYWSVPLRVSAQRPSKKTPCQGRQQAVSPLVVYLNAALFFWVQPPLSPFKIAEKRLLYLIYVEKYMQYHYLANCPRIADFPMNLPRILRPLTAIFLVKALRQGSYLRLIECFPGEGCAGRTVRSSSGPTSVVFNLVYGRLYPAYGLCALLPPLPLFVFPAVDSV